MSLERMWLVYLTMAVLGMSPTLAPSWGYILSPLALLGALYCVGRALRDWAFSTSKTRPES